MPDDDIIEDQQPPADAPPDDIPPDAPPPDTVPDPDPQPAPTVIRRGASEPDQVPPSAQ